MMFKMNEISKSMRMTFETIGGEKDKAFTIGEHAGMNGASIPPASTLKLSINIHWCDVRRLSAISAREMAQIP